LEAKPIQSFLKPRRKRYIKQGFFRCRNVGKYVGDPSQIIYRSGWELAFLKYCDSSENVLKYGSEPVGIRYINALDNRQHVYYVDFFMETIGTMGTVQRWLIEIKPDKHTRPPKRPVKQTYKSMRNYNSALRRYMMNMSKFKAARQYAGRLGFKFCVMSYDTDKDTFKIIDWEANENLLRKA
jgi:hypothetical protein